MKQKPKAALLALVIATVTFPALPAGAQLNGPLAPYKPQPSAGSIQIDVDMVLVNVSVTDAYGHLIANLEKKNFRLFEDNVEQEIVTFSNEDVPASIGLLFDTSGSMADKMDASRQAVAHFLQKSNPNDEFFLINFDNRAELTSRFTSNIEQLQQRMMSLKPNGRTALLDAINLGMAQMKSARNERHILLIISDGGDNHSRHHVTEVRNLLKESDCQLYALGIFDARDMKRTTEEREGPSLLLELAEMTGGHLFQAASLSELVDLSGKIGTELRSQYILGYKPSDLRHDGRWRRIKVSLTPPNDRPLTARARTGYYSPRD
jgi:Ca-activated chloride channel family protein